MGRRSIRILATPAWLAKAHVTHATARAAPGPGHAAVRAWLMPPEAVHGHKKARGTHAAAGLVRRGGARRAQRLRVFCACPKSASKRR